MFPIFLLFALLLLPYCIVGAPQAIRKKTGEASEDIVNRVAGPDGAFCDKRVPAYLVFDKHRIKSSVALPFNNMSENSCAQMCSDNKDKQDNKLLCSSFNYHKKNRTCTIFRQKAKPAGQEELILDDQFRYYEKFCLPIYAPLDCGESLFFRSDQAVLEGSALNSTKAKRLDTCIHECIKRSDECKSAMYFPEVEECIINIDSAQDVPDSFVEEKREDVVYFENGCTLGNQVRNQKKARTDPPDTTTEKLTSVSKHALDTDVENEAEESENEESVVTAAPEFGEWKEWGECDRPDGRRIRKRPCYGAVAACKHKMMESQWCTDITTPSTTEEHSTEESTTTATTTTTTKTTTSKPKTTTTLQERDEEEPTTKKSTKKPKTTTLSDEDETEEPATKVPTRKVQKPTKANEDDDATTSSPVSFLAPLFTPPAFVPKSSGAWGPWSRDCQPFQENQQCVEGSIVGFQNRQCTKSPSECQGPFFRYCFIPCQSRGQG